MLKTSFTLAAIFLSVCAVAQDFLVNLQGDTIKGTVKALTYGPDIRVQVTEPGKKKTIYPFFKVKSFSADGAVYQPVKGPYGYAFMKLIKDGYLSLYSFQAPNQTQYDGMYLLKKDGDGIEVPNLTFKKGMRRFLEDCPVVADKIDSDVLNKKDLHKIIDEYNACIDNQTAYQKNVVEEKPTREVKPVRPETASAWDALENKVKSQADFAEKENALEMISEIKNKISASQKIPNFLIEGLKSTLNQDVFKAELENALKEID